MQVMPASVQLVRENGDVSLFPINDQTTYIGRSKECQIQINSNTVSRRHACIQSQGDKYYISDLGSANGTTVNGQPLIPHQPHLLHHQDQIKVDVFELNFLVTSAVPTCVIPTETVEYKDVNVITATLTINFGDKSRLTIGRHEDNDIVIPHPAVSSFHAVLLRSGNQIYLNDLQSRNGTFVNGQRITGKKFFNKGIQYALLPILWFSMPMLVLRPSMKQVNYS
ncbi:MAG: FHA domain-containing protein [Pseudanabaenaceae cyanobacterium]